MPAHAGGALQASAPRQSLGLGTLPVVSSMGGSWWARAGRPVCLGFILNPQGQLARRDLRESVCRESSGQVPEHAQTVCVGVLLPCPAVLFSALQVEVPVCCEWSQNVPHSPVVSLGAWLLHSQLERAGSFLLPKSM